MITTVDPKIGIGSVKLGMTRDQVRAALVVLPKTYLQNKFAEFETDHFKTLGIQVDYDRHGVCNYISVHSIADPVLFGKHPTQMSFDECTQWLLTLDPDLEIESDCVISRKLGVSTYTSLYPEDPVECIAVFVDGYYDEP